VFGGHSSRDRTVRVMLLAVVAGCGGDPVATCAHDAGGDPGGTLGDLARAGGRHAGTFLFGSDGAPAAFDDALKEFDLYTLPIFFRLVEPERHRFDFSLADAVIDKAPPDTVFYAPGFSNDILPDWLVSGGFSGADRAAIMTTYITTVMTHLQAKAPGRIVAWEVVLEPMSWNGPDGFWHAIGLEAGHDQYEYMRLAYRTARATVPDAKLYTDDFLVEDFSDRAQKLYELVDGLRGEGVPLDGVGFEGHFMLGGGGAFPHVPAHDTLVANLNRFSGLGVETMYTSIDISMRDVDVSPALLSVQADAYRTLVDACTCATSCAAITTWGVGDPNSWIVQQFPGWGTPLLFDAQYAKKPAYYAFRAGLVDAGP
jgi:endo-1,4-beta-xylanase